MIRLHSVVSRLAVRRSFVALCVAVLFATTTSPAAARVDLRAAAKAVKKQAKKAKSTARRAEREMGSLVVDAVRGADAAAREATLAAAADAREATAEAERLAAEAKDAAASLGEDALELARSLARQAEVEACKAALVVSREKARVEEAVAAEARRRIEELRENQELLDRIAWTVDEFQRRYSETIEALESRVPSLELSALDDLEDALSLEGVCSGRASDAFPAVSRLGGELVQLTTADSGEAAAQPDRVVTFGFQGAAAKFLGGEAGAGLAWELPGRALEPNGLYAFMGPQLGSFVGASKVAQIGLWPTDFCGLAGPYLAVGFIPTSYGTASRSIGLSIDIVLDVALLEDEAWRDGPVRILEDYFVGVVWNFGVSTSTSRVSSKLAAKAQSAGSPERGWQVPHFAIQGGSTGVFPFESGCPQRPLFGSG